VPDAVHLGDREDVAGHGGDREDGQLDGDRGGLGGVRRDEGDDPRRGDRVAVVGVVEQEPAARGPGQQDEQPAVGEEGPQAGFRFRRCRALGAARALLGGRGLEAVRLRQLAPQPDGGGGRDGAKAEQEAPRGGRAGAAAQEGEGEQRADDQADGLRGEDKADLAAAVLACPRTRSSGQR